MENNMEEPIQEKPKKRGIAIFVIIAILLISLGVFLSSNFRSSKIPNSTTAEIDENGNVIDGDNIDVVPEPSQADEIVKATASSPITINIVASEEAEETK